MNRIELQVIEYISGICSILNNTVQVKRLQLPNTHTHLHVVATDGNAVKLGHVLRSIGENVLNDPHRGARRVDVGVAHHVLLQNVVLDGACQLRLSHTWQEEDFIV